MKLFLSLIFLISTTICFTQRIVPFEIEEEFATKVENSLYNQIEVIDARKESDTIGLVGLRTMAPSLRREGIPMPLRRVDLLKLETSLEDQIKLLFTNQTNENAQNGKLLIRVKKLHYYDEIELPGVSRIPNSFSFSADLFSSKDSNYYFLARIDTFHNHKTILRTNSRNLIKTGKKIIANFIEENLTKQASSSLSHSYNQIINWEKLIKETLPIFKNNSFSDGVYLTYETFKNQTPDKTNFEVELDKTGNLKKVLEIDESSGDRDKIRKVKLYAVVYKGVAYVPQYSILTSIPYLKLIYEDDDFYVNSRQLINVGTNLFLTKICIKKLRISLSLDRFPILKYKLNPRDGRFEAVDYAKEKED